MRALTRFCTLILLLCSSTLAQAASEVIQLNFRMAQDILPVAQSVLGSDGRASAYGNQLIVNASQDKIAELRSVLERIDIQPRRLLITVDSQGNQHNSERGYHTDGSIDGRHGEITLGQGEQQGQDRIRIIRNNTQGRDTSLQTVQTLEGSAALLQVGQSIPQRSSRYDQYGHIQEYIEYRSVNQGFYVTATVHGDQVQLEINSQNDRRSQQYNNVIETQSTSSRVSGRLGEWINVSASSQDNQQHQDGFLQQRNSTGQETSQLQIKVEVLD
ncbi:MAG: secretin [Pseudomonas sp.]|nr:secretin [Pseudomonas sp.]